MLAGFKLLDCDKGCARSLRLSARYTALGKASGYPSVKLICPQQTLAEVLHFSFRYCLIISNDFEESS